MREREITDDWTWRIKEGKTRKRERQALSASCPEVVAMPSAKQAFYQFRGFTVILVYEILPHKTVHGYTCENNYSAWSICWLTVPE